jgi:hypothetical protein
MVEPVPLNFFALLLTAPLTIKERLQGARQHKSRCLKSDRPLNRAHGEDGTRSRSGHRPREYDL